MMEFAVRVLRGAMLASLYGGAAAAADLSELGQWTGEFPSGKAAGGRPLWEQPGVQAAMRAAMGNYFLAVGNKDARAPEAPVTSDGLGHFAVWSCNNPDDCGGNQMTVYFDVSAGSAQVCWRSSEGTGGKVKDLWLAEGSVRPLPVNGCGVAKKDPFAPLKKFGAKQP